MATAQDIIESALRKIHVLGVGSSLSNEEAQDALTTLNDLLSTWSAEGHLVFTETRETFSLTSAVSYTIGSGATFNTTRPIYILSAFVTQGDIDYPLRAIDVQEYDSLAFKSQGGAYPNRFYYDADYPTGTIYLYPAPGGVTSITLTSVKPLTSFAALTTDFSMPEEYRSALVYNVAVWLAPEYEREASSTVKKIAYKTKKVVKAQNKRNEKSTSHLVVPSREGQDGNIYGGWWTQ